MLVVAMLWCSLWSSLWPEQIPCDVTKTKAADCGLSYMMNLNCSPWFKMRRMHPLQLPLPLLGNKEDNCCCCLPFVWSLLLLFVGLLMNLNYVIIYAFTSLLLLVRWYYCFVISCCFMAEIGDYFISPFDDSASVRDRVKVLSVSSRWIRKGVVQSSAWYWEAGVNSVVQPCPWFCTVGCTATTWL